MKQPFFFPPVSFSSKKPQVYIQFKQIQAFTQKALFIWSYNNIGNNNNLDYLLGVSGTTREYIGKFLKLKQIPLTTISVSYTHLTLPTKA